MQNQNQRPSVLVMSQDQLQEFEVECLNNLKTKQFKKIIKHLSRFLIDPNAFAQNIIDQYEANKAGKIPVEPSTPEHSNLKKEEKPSVSTIEPTKAPPLDGKNLKPVPEVKKP